MLKNIGLQLSWQRFYENSKADIKLWCYFVLFQQACRLCFIYSLSHHLAPKTKFTTILYAALHGVRFDSLWATCWIFFALAFFTLPSIFFAKMTRDTMRKYRRYLGGFFTVATTFIYISSVEYFREYKDVFNQFLFNWFYDDQVAILKTIYSEHNVFLHLGLLVAVVLLYVWISSAVVRHPNAVGTKKHSVFFKVILSIAIVCFYVIAFRGSIGRRPIQVKDAGVTTDSFLNKAIISPYSSFKYAINDYQDINRACQNDANLSVQEARAIAKKFFNTDQQYCTIAQYMEKTTKGATSVHPKHIFLIVGESLDAWSFQDEYRDLDLVPNLQKLAAKKEGIHFKYFLPGADGTMETLNTIMAGIPDTGLHINYQMNGSSPCPATLAPQFKKLGFKPQFFYGGYLSWQRVGDFAEAQGFENVYGAAHIKNWQQTNEWGVDDRTLFDFIVENVKASDVPTFNVIMTTSNHPPFSINLEKEGFNKEKATKVLAKYLPTKTSVKQLGHIWYTDKTIGEFVEKITAEDKTALFAITGDHFGRRHVLPNPPSFDTTAVPLILYGEVVEDYCNKYDCKDPNSIAGSHLDLGATLIELAAPKGFAYSALGDNLFAKRKFNVGLGKNKVITPDFIASVGGEDIMYFNDSKYSSGDIEVLKERSRQATYLARYIIKKGDILDESEPTHEIEK